MNLPGLDLESIVNNMVDTLYPDYSEEKKDELKQYYMTDGAENIEKNINAISVGTENAKSCLTALNSAATAVPTLASIPSVIVAGSATGAPNPAWYATFNTFAKSCLQSQTYVATIIIADVESACASIAYEPPAEIRLLKEQLEIVKNVIENIP